MSPQVTELNRPYQPIGSALALMGDRSPEILMSGPAGTGKSRACLEKIHWCASKYPNSRYLIVRKTRESLTESALVTFEDHVVPVGHPILTRVMRRMRQNYQYPNGSEVIVGGLDKVSKVMSTEYDAIYVQEAVELEEEDWEGLTTRLRNNKVPYQQIIADTNPSYPTHWLYQRCLANKTKLVATLHSDNPTVTPAYLAVLDELTGPRKARLRDGLWVSAEGQVYEEWDPAIHMVDKFYVPFDWTRYWVVDFGFTNPFCWQEWVQDGDGRLFLHKQIYETQKIVEDHAKRIKYENRHGRDPYVLLGDHDAEDRATLERHLGVTTTPAFKDVSPGIQAVNARLRLRDDGTPGLRIMRDSLLTLDKSLLEKKRPTRTEEEFEGYVWNTTGGKRKGEEPIKVNDHGMDNVRYVVSFVDGIQAAGYAPAFSSRKRRIL